LVFRRVKRELFRKYGVPDDVKSVKKPAVCSKLQVFSFKMLKKTKKNSKKVLTLKLLENLRLYHDTTGKQRAEIT